MKVLVAEEGEGAVGGGDEMGDEVGEVFMVVIAAGAGLGLEWERGWGCSFGFFSFVFGFSFLSSFSASGGGGVVGSAAGRHTGGSECKIGSFVRWVCEVNGWLFGLVQWG